MDKQLLKNLLKHDFWNQYKDKLLVSLFSDEVSEFYEIITDYHSKYDTDIPASALPAMWKDKNPVSTRAEESVINQLAFDIAHEDDLPSELAGELINGLWKREIGRKIGALGLNIAEGRTEAFEKLTKLLDGLSSGFEPDDFPDPITDNIYELMDEFDDSKKHQFNIRTLREKVIGIGGGDFVVVFARPETGKTAFITSIVAGPGGFCEKGAKVLYLGNEEKVKKTKFRAMMAFGGLTKEDILTNPDGAMATYDLIKPRLIMQEIVDWDLNRVEAYIKKIEPDIVVIDQLDKVDVSGKYEKSTDKLRELYLRTRGIAIKHDVAIIAVSQASALAENKTILHADMMENSRTGKFAEADLILGIGKMEDNPDGSQDPLRFITVSKNKLSGWHGTITCKIEPLYSRYSD
jgi:replicative DNA helicase